MHAIFSRLNIEILGDPPYFKNHNPLESRCPIILWEALIEEFLRREHSISRTSPISPPPPDHSYLRAKKSLQTLSDSHLNCAVYSNFPKEVLN